MNGIKAIFLDVDNTLLDFNLCAKAAMKSAFQNWNIEFKDEYFPVFLDVNRYLWEEIEKDKIKKEDVFPLRFKMIFNKIGLFCPDASGLDATFRKNMEDLAIPVEGAFEVLSYLAKKHMVCITSNASYNRQLNRLTTVNMMQYVSHLFSSEQIGCMKPAKLFFDRCLKIIGGISPSEVFVIGDSLTADIQGGINAGMHTIWYNHEKQEDNLFVLPEYKVNSLLEIKKIL